MSGWLDADLEERGAGPQGLEHLAWDSSGQCPLLLSREGHELLAAEVSDPTSHQDSCLHLTGEVAQGWRCGGELVHSGQESGKFQSTVRDSMS